MTLDHLGLKLLVTIGLSLSLSSQIFCQGSEEDDAYSSPPSITTPVLSEETPTTENEIPIFPSTTLRSDLKRRGPAKPHQHARFPGIKKKKVGEESSEEVSSTELSLIGGTRKNFRLMKFFRHFRLDFSKFDSTCIRRGGRGVSAPVVRNAHIFKYTRRRNRALPRNRYAMALFECDADYEFPPASADRMFCSRSKWVGPRPVCLPKGSLDESEAECSKCQHICNREDGPSPVCACYAGYEMLNGSCSDIDECGTNNGGCFGICYNTPGSFQCFCPSGFQVGPDGKNCIDRNECLLRNGHGPCQDRCNNTVGSYTCSCERIPGTKLAVDKHSCEDINECKEENNFGCSHTCLNTFGNAFCSCPKGFILSTIDYKTCLSEIQNEKEEEDGEQILVPENLMGEPPKEAVTVPVANELISPEVLSTRIDCPPGSEHDAENLQICIEHEDCSFRNGGCDHTCVPSGSFRFCSCRPGYELLNETTCVDLNECEQENGGCDQHCVNTEGSFYCDCKDSHQLLEDKRTCQAKFCEEPITVTTTGRWDCELPDGSELAAGEKPPVGTRCRLACLPGLALHLNLPTPSPATFYHRFHYDVLRDEPEVVVKENQLIIKCLATGQWSEGKSYLDMISCVSSNCPRLLAPEHGSLFPEACQEEGVPLHSQCLVLCSAGFYPRNGRIRTCSKSLKWFPEENTICLRLPPTPRPYIHCPSDLIVDLKAGQSSTHVIIPQPQANYAYRYVEAEPPWAKSLEWDVPAGVTQVVFTARSPISNDSATCHFKIHIVDREAPRVQGCPTSFEIRLDPGETSKEVWWSDPKFTDNVKLHYVQQSHTPGHLLTRGTHHVTYVAGDAEANKARCAFTVTVHGSEDYEMGEHSSFYSSSVIGRHMIICPNLKTGRWNLHFAYYLPPGCRYHSQQHGGGGGGVLSKIFKQKQNPAEDFPARLRRRATRRRF